MSDLISTRRAQQLQRLAKERDDADAAAKRVRSQIKRAMEAAHAEGATFDEIAALLGITRQATLQQFHRQR